VRSDALERPVPEGPAQTLHFVREGGVQDKSYPRRWRRAPLGPAGAEVALAGLSGVAKDDDAVVVDLDEAALHLEPKLVGTPPGVHYTQGWGSRAPT